MSEAVNNPYKQEAPDKTLSIEGEAADAKATGDALNKRMHYPTIPALMFLVVSARLRLAAMAFSN